jgi:hypothetical protein
LGLGRFISGTLCSGTFWGWDVFGLGRFVLGCFVGAPKLESGQRTIESGSVNTCCSRHEDPRGQLTCLEIKRKNKKNVVDCMCICIYMSCRKSIMFTCMKVLRLCNSCQVGGLGM